MKKLGAILLVTFAWCGAALPVIQAMGGVVGAVTACVLWVELGNPLKLPLRGGLPQGDGAESQGAQQRLLGWATFGIGCSCLWGASSSVSRGHDRGFRRDLGGSPFDGRR
ncbi:MAG TPA: hypothetical protein VH575_11500, partial [Gemmataceae bacterium]